MKNIYSLDFDLGDVESTGLSRSFDTVNSVAFLGDNLLNFSFRPPAEQLIHPEALLIQGLTPEEVYEKPKRSFLEGVQDIASYFKKRNQGSLIFHNAGFDSKMLEMTLFRGLQAPYQYKYGRTIIDSLSVARMLSVVNSDFYVPQINGRNTFQLTKLARAHNVEIGKPHSAEGDVLTLGNLMVSWEQKFSQEMGDIFGAISDKKVLNELIAQGPVYLCKKKRLIPYAGIGKHPVFKTWNVLYPIQENNSDVTNCQFIKPSQPPAALFAGSSTVKNVFSCKEIKLHQSLTEKLKRDSNFQALINTALIEKAESYKAPVYVEQRIASDGFYSRDDLKRIDDFHSAEPKHKIKIVESFSDDRLKILGIRQVFDNWPETLPAQKYGIAMERLHQRLTIKNDVPWMTIPRALEVIEATLPQKIGQDSEILKRYRSWLLRKEATLSKFSEAA